MNTCQVLYQHLWFLHGSKDHPYHNPSFNVCGKMWHSVACSVEAALCFCIGLNHERCQLLSWAGEVKMQWQDASLAVALIRLFHLLITLPSNFCFEGNMYDNQCLAFYLKNCNCYFSFETYTYFIKCVFKSEQSQNTLLQRYVTCIDSKKGWWKQIQVLYISKKTLQYCKNTALKVNEWCI